MLCILMEIINRDKLRYYPYKLFTFAGQILRYGRLIQL